MTNTFVPVSLTVEEFDALPESEQRVVIAKDVIAQLHEGRYFAEMGNWVEPDEDVEYSKEALTDEYTPVCKVCGLGALFLSAVRFGNGFRARPGSMLLVTQIESVLIDIFNHDQISLIEQAFEQGRGQYSGDEGAIHFGQQYDYDEERLLAIMNNIVRNDGEFIVTDDGEFFP